MSVKDLIYDPEHFLETLEQACSDEISTYMDARTEEWKARGKDKAIRSSSLGTCIRQSYYGYFSERTSDPIEDIFARKRMYMGFVNEETQAKILGRMDGHLHGVESIEQNQFPVHIRVEEDVVCTATTDFVHEYDYRDKKEEEIRNLNNDHSKLKNEIEMNQKNYEKLIDEAADEISSFVEKANLENLS